MSENARATELEAALSRAEAGSRAKGEVLAIMSHELRNPLNALLGFSQLLALDPSEPLTPRQCERVEQILRSGELLLHLLDEVTALSSSEVLGTHAVSEPVPLRELLEDVMSRLGGVALRAGVKVRMGSTLSGVSVDGIDRARFVQILLNLGVNAIKFNRPNGLVTFSAFQPAPRRLRISVADTGPGSPLERQAQLFDSTQSPLPPVGSCGMFVAKHLAQAMDGDIGFRSTLGERSEFWVEGPWVPRGLESGGECSRMRLGESHAVRVVPRSRS